jgi:hypothetical protein
VSLFFCTTPTRLALAITLLASVCVAADFCRGTFSAQMLMVRAHTSKEKDNESHCHAYDLLARKWNMVMICSKQLKCSTSFTLCAENFCENDYHGNLKLFAKNLRFQETVSSVYRKQYLLYLERKL